MNITFFERHIENDNEKNCSKKYKKSSKCIQMYPKCIHFEKNVSKKGYIG